MSAELECKDFRNRLKQHEITQDDWIKIWLSQRWMQKADLGYFRDSYSTDSLFNFLRCNVDGVWDWSKLGSGVRSCNEAYVHAQLAVSEPSASMTVFTIERAVAPAHRS